MRKWLKESMLLPIIACLLIVSSFFFQSFGDFVEGYYQILISESILLTDFVEVGGIGPTLFNSGSLMLLSYILVRKLDIKITGSIFAGIMTIGGFAFFGKNILNVSIIFLGILFYSFYKQISLKSIIIVFLFATGIGPISSLIIFGLGIPYLISIPLGILVGVLSGFLLVELSSHVISFHKGYNLYNIGFACGILSLSYYSLLSILNVEYESNLIYANDSHFILVILFVVICLTFLFFGLFLNNWTFEGIPNILKKSGRAVTDFTRRNNEAATMLNVGTIGLIALLLISLIGIRLNGPVIGGLLTIIGFGAFGKHIRNIYPPMIGVILVVVLLQLDMSITIILAILFSTGLAPLSGERGILVGVLSGMLHLPIALSLGVVHGGILLYANGFAAAFTAVVIDTLVISFERRKKHGTT